MCLVLLDVMLRLICCVYICFHCVRNHARLNMGTHTLYRWRFSINHAGKQMWASASWQAMRAWGLRTRNDLLMQQRPRMLRGNVESDMKTHDAYPPTVARSSVYLVFSPFSFSLNSRSSLHLTIDISVYHIPLDSLIYDFRFFDP